MSKAFDTIDRKILLQVFKAYLESSDYRIALLLLSDTSYRIKIGGKHSKQSFEAWMGIFQGDSVCPAFFIIYFEIALHKVEEGFVPRGRFNMNSAYADDYDYLSSNRSSCRQWTA